MSENEILFVVGIIFALAYTFYKELKRLNDEE